MSSIQKAWMATVQPTRASTIEDFMMFGCNFHFQFSLSITFNRQVGTLNSHIYRSTTFQVDIARRVRDDQHHIYNPRNVEMTTARLRRVSTGFSLEMRNAVRVVEEESIFMNQSYA